MRLLNKDNILEQVEYINKILRGKKKGFTRIATEDFNITSDPNSLYEDHPGQIGNEYFDRVPKPEPTLTDLYNKLICQNTDEKGNPNIKVTRILDALKPYLKSGSSPIFDGQTNFGKGRSALLNSYKY